MICSLSEGRRIKLQLALLSTEELKIKLARFLHDWPDSALVPILQEILTERGEK